MQINIFFDVGASADSVSQYKLNINVDEHAKILLGNESIKTDIYEKKTEIQDSPATPERLAIQRLSNEVMELNNRVSKLEGMIALKSFLKG